MAIVNHIACHKTFYLKEIRPTPSKIILYYFTWPYRGTGGRGDGENTKYLSLDKSNKLSPIKLKNLNSYSNQFSGLFIILTRLPRI